MSLFSSETIKLNMVAKNKMSAIDEMIDILFENSILNDKYKYKKAILEREESATTGIGFGIAIPHAKTDAVNTAHVAVGICRTGFDFESVDGSLSKIIFMIAVPNNADNLHLKILAKLSAKLMDLKFREKIINCNNKQIILSYLNNI
ncbi:PTS sugar transporter subunit IIA [Pectinatus frisingensis]|jgi:PTS system fructose-specific IIC component|uniref:PTS sugar transporter subunit IIA n=1 Tax=Pectinatus frisingensis TaxID=865 RepID=UPI0018C7A038|nr:fructose PTS transporter subunit IIA [Pectinatus frisingensis]